MVELKYQATDDDVNVLRSMILEKYESYKATDEFHPKDLQRLKNSDEWIIKFLNFSDGNMKVSFKQLWEALEWRQKYGVNDICEENVRMDYLIDSSIFLHGRDLFGKNMLIVKSKSHVRGARNMEDLKRCFIYWMERGVREANYDQLTLIFDMNGAGMGNVDLEYMKVVINTIKTYYPESLRWILVYEMPWVMNATFQIIKRLLPKKAVEVLRVLNTKTIREHVGEDNMLVEWGGKDDYVYSFIPEKRQNDEVKKDNGEDTLEDVQRKVSQVNISMSGN